MNITQNRFIEGWTQEILLRYSQRNSKPLELPIPIFDIAEKFLALKYDIEFFRGKLGEVSAITIPAKHWILLNQDQSDRRLRFSLAHEVVHWLVEEFAEPNASGEEYNVAYLRSSEAKVRERAADYFAGALLMPRALVIEHSKQHNRDNEVDIRCLAALFGVSIKAMRTRFDQISEQPRELNKLEKNLLSAYVQQNAVPTLATRPYHTLVRPPHLVFDYRLIRRLRRARKERRNVYFVLNQKHQENLDLLMELKYGDGFVFFQDSSQQSADHLAELTEVELLDFEVHDGYYQRFCENSQKDETKTTMMVYTRDSEDEFPSKQLEIKSVSRYVEPKTALHTREDAKKYINRRQVEGKKVVIVTGCFDLITNAHVRFLKRAKAAGDILVVGIEDDYRIKAFKGALRPVNTESQRVEVLEAFRSVDFTFIIHGSPRYDVIPFYSRLHRSLGADILAVTEGDPHIDDRRDEIESTGGKLAIVSKMEDGSTTSILRRFLAETVFSDMVFVKKRTLYRWAKENSDSWKQIKLPFAET